MATQQHSAGPAACYGDHTSREQLLLPRAMRLEQSLLLADGKLLTLSVDLPAGEFVLARHLRSGLLDESFGEQGIQRIASDIASNASGLSLEPGTDGTLVVRGMLIQEETQSQSGWQLRIMPTDQARPYLGVDAFIDLSH